MSARLLNRFKQELAAGRKLFVPYITAGDRGLDFTRQAVLALDQAGADAVELGVPFSDPLADGKVIQRSSHRALEQGTNLPGIISLVQSLRRKTNIPILLMGYLNPFLQPDMSRNASLAQVAGVDGFIIPDLPPEEAGSWISICRKKALNTVFLTTPNSTPNRLKAIIQYSNGYIYYVSVTGTTGQRDKLPADMRAGVDRIRRYSSLPILVGFGISTPRQAAEVAGIADGVIVGSALIRAMEQGKTKQEALHRLRHLAEEMVKAIKGRS
ncbi:tryptophan synthase subunit alpha [bacterium]|nr:tryptophan synthase subunit alpha [bacterium]